MGSGDVRVPDRRLAAGGRRRRQHLAPLHAPAGQDRERRHRRRRVRSLPALGVRRRADALPGPGGVPLQHLVVARAAGGPRACEREGPGFLLPPRGPPSRARDPAERHALPLGPARRPRRSRRLVVAGLARVVRRLREGDLRSARRPRADVGDPQRTVGDRGRGLPARRQRAGARQRRRGPAGRAPPAARARRRRGDLPRRRLASPDRPRRQPRTQGPGLQLGGGSGRHRARARLLQRTVPGIRSCSVGTLPRSPRSTENTGGRGAPRNSRASRGRSTSWA